jgi:FHA domain
MSASEGQGTLPRPATARELKDVMDAERRGVPFLLYRDGAGEQRLVPLEGGAGARVIVGRGDAVDVALDWDGRVSTVHAELSPLGGVWAIADEGLSRNGTWVNGERLHGRRRLRGGDLIRLGNTPLAYHDEAPEGPGPTITHDDAREYERVTDAQRRVLVALCRPYRERTNFAVPASNQAIADELVVSVEAVKTHLKTLYQRFGLEQLPQNEKRARLAERALELGLARPSDG